jgi:hypothetical protein
MGSEKAYFERSGVTPFLADRELLYTNIPMRQTLWHTQGDQKIRHGRLWPCRIIKASWKPGFSNNTFAKNGMR